MVQGICPNCRHAVPEDARFCGACGVEFAGPPARGVPPRAPPIAARGRSPDRPPERHFEAKPKTGRTAILVAALITLFAAFQTARIGDSVLASYLEREPSPFRDFRSPPPGPEESRREDRRYDARIVDLRSHVNTQLALDFALAAGLAALWWWAKARPLRAVAGALAATVAVVLLGLALDALMGTAGLPAMAVAIAGLGIGVRLALRHEARVQEEALGLEGADLAAARRARRRKF